MRTARPGATLIEAVVALTLLALVGLTGVELARAAADSGRLVADSESTFERASDLLGAVTLWSRRELDQRLGERVQGDWRLELQRIAPELYLATLRDSTGTVTILRTALFRRSTPDDTQ